MENDTLLYISPEELIKKLEEEIVKLHNLIKKTTTQNITNNNNNGTIINNNIYINPPGKENPTLFSLTNKDVKEILHKEIEYPEFLSEDCVDLLKYLLERDINLRYDCEKALEHSFLN